MRTVMKSLRFWGGILLKMLGNTFATAFIIIMILYMSNGNAASGGIETELSLFPYYLVIAGFFMIFVCGYNWFQTYFCMLISMNVTRKAAVYGILAVNLTYVLGINLLAAVLWKVFPGEISAGGLSLVHLFTGVFLISSSICTLMGVIMLRWGKIGVALTVLFMTLIGGAFGACVALPAGTVTSGMQQLVVHLDAAWPAAGIGVLCFGMTGFAARILLRKIEARV